MKDEKNESGVECIYRSLSGRTYTSSNKYDYEGSDFVTTFGNPGE
jgi:hypothetical protein